MTNRTRMIEDANKLGLGYSKNITTKKLRELLAKNGIEYEDKTVDEAKKKMNKPSDGKMIKCIVKCIDPNYPMNVAEIGVNGHYLSVPIDKEIEISSFFIPTLKNTKWDKAILDDNGQVKAIKMENRFIVERI